MILAFMILAKKFIAVVVEVGNFYYIYYNFRNKKKLQ